MKYLFLCLLLVACQGCRSPKAKAQSANAKIVQHANAGKGEIGKARPFTSEEGVPHLNKADFHFNGITAQATEELAPNLQKLENPESWWDRAVGYLWKILVGIVSLFVLFFLGELKIIPGLGWLLTWLAKKGISFSRTASHEAALAAKVRYQDGDTRPETEALIAVRRTESPTYNGAFMREKERIRSKVQLTPAEQAAVREILSRRGSEA